MTTWDLIKEYITLSLIIIVSILLIQKFRADVRAANAQEKIAVSLNRLAETIDPPEAVSFSTGTCCSGFVHRSYPLIK